jgi:hypothetical protein
MNFLYRLFEPGPDVTRLVRGEWLPSRPVPPAWLWVLVGVGTVLALVNFLPQLTMRTGVRVGTFLLRLGMLGLLLVVLCGLEYQALIETEDRQQWTMLLDDSASMATRDVDGGSRYAAARADLDRLRDAVSSRVNLRVETVSGAAAGDEPGQGPTPFREAITRAALARSRPDRLIVLTDGRDSEARDLFRLGEDLRARDVKLSVRLYGSDQPPADTAITAEPERNAIRLGEEIVIRGSITGGRGEESITIKEDGKDVGRVIVPAKGQGRFVARHRPKAKGQHVYTLELGGSDAVPENNSTRFTVQVVQEKINVLLIEGFPRFEFKLIKAVLEVDPLVNLVSVCHVPGGGVHVQGEPLHRNPEQGLITAQADLFKYDVVILRDVPRALFRAGGDTTESRLQHIVQFVTKRGGGLVVLGGQDTYNAGGYGDSHLAEVLPFDLSQRIAPEDQFDGLFFVTIPKPAYDHPLLQLLPDPVENRERLNSLRQLDGSNNVGRFKPLATPLMTRTVQIKGKGDKPIEREAPIMGYLAVGDGKVLAASVDTLWRWQLQPDFADPPLTMLLANAMRLLAPPPGRKPGAPNVTIGTGAPQVGQDLLLATDLKDQNFDPITGADLLVTVTRPDGTSYRIYPRDLPEEPGHYAYRVPLDQPGPYKVKAAFGKFEATRDFLAGAAAGEFADLSVDRAGMARLVEGANGATISTPLDTWLQSVDAQPVRQQATRDLEVWNSWPVLLVFFGLVSVDCYLRKRQGLA